MTSQVGLRGAELAWHEWFLSAHGVQYPVGRPTPATWLVTGGRGSGKTRLGAEWATALARCLPPFAEFGNRYDRIALVGETLGDAREVMVEGPSGILTIAREDRPRFEPTRRRLLWPSGAVGQLFSSEDPESLRGPQFSAAWCDELGCPATDKGPNQPNVFPDPKSMESAAPYFSDGSRSDIAQRRFIEAHLQHWDAAGPGFQQAWNPVSPAYGGRMLDLSRIYLWAWDARPFPAFPQRADVWSDGVNWERGHWLNGRLASPDLGALINAVLADHGLPAADVSGADGVVHGYVVDDPSSARASLEPLVDLFDLTVIEQADGLVFRQAGQAGAAVSVTELVLDDDRPAVETMRVPDQQLPAEALLAFRDPFSDYQSATARFARQGAAGARQQVQSFSGVLEKGQGQALAEDWLRRTWYERETIGFSVAMPDDALAPGAVVTLPASGNPSEFLVTGVEDGLVCRVSARQIARGAVPRWRSVVPRPPVPPVIVSGRPHAVFLDLPAGVGEGSLHDQLRVAVWQKPWRTQALSASPETTGFTARAMVAKSAVLGRLTAPLAPGFEGRIDRAGAIFVELFDRQAESISVAQMLNGANAAAVRSTVGVWEVLQFQQATEIEPQLWRLSGLLRGQLGTSDAMAAGAAEGADFVLLDDAVVPAGLRSSEVGLVLNWRVGPTGLDGSGLNVAESTAVGGQRAALPLAPVHLRARRAGADVVFSWIRRGRVDADGWDASDIPLGEAVEQYRVEIAAPGGMPVRTVVTAEPRWLYEAAMIVADFTAPPAAIDVTVRQFSVTAGWGVPVSKRLSIA